MTLSRKYDLIGLLGVIAVILIGYYKFFLGANFFSYEDWVGVSGYTYGNTLGNGWRPEKILGMSFYFGEPGMWHPWSFLSLLERISPSREWAYGFSVLSLGSIAACAMYVFIRVIAPSLGRPTAVLLSPLIVFCSSQQGYQYGRVGISLLAGMPLFLLLLKEYFTKEDRLHFFYAVFLLFFVACFGNLWSLTELCSLGVAFTILYGIYFKPKKVMIFKKIAALYSWGIFTFMILSFWLLFPFFFEFFTVGYARVKTMAFPSHIPFFPNLQGLYKFFMGFLQIEWLPRNAVLPLLPRFVSPYTFNVCLTFPLVFLFFLFHKSKTFWEFALKWLMIIFLTHWLLLLGNIIPGYGPIFSYLSSASSKIITMYDYIFPLQVGLIAIFISYLGKEDICVQIRGGRFLQWCIAVFFSTALAVGAIFCALTLISKEIIPLLLGGGFTKLFPAGLVNTPTATLVVWIDFFVRSVQDLVRWHTLLFCLTGLLLSVPFLTKEWLKRFSGWPKVFVALLFIVNGVCLSWSISPLNTKGLIWQQKALTSCNFKPTDRFFFVKEDVTEDKKTLESLEKNWLNVDGFGKKEWVIGISEPPGLNFSGLVSFCQKDVAKFIYYIFNDSGKKNIKNIRMYFGGQLLYSELLDMCAVNYYYSDRPLKNVPSNLTLYAKVKNLFVYKNSSAWPYYYLANRLERNTSGVELSQVVLGTAYLYPKDMFSLPGSIGASKIQLIDFHYGSLQFAFEGKEEFLVIADAWHPLWKARVDGKELPVIKANAVFKGVRLPAGKYTLTVYFDNSPYKIGIYVSLVAWAIFLIGFFRMYKQRRGSCT